MMEHDAMTVQPLELEIWRLLRAEAGADGDSHESLGRWLAGRAAARPAVAAVVERFASGIDGIDEFRRALDGDIREAANMFGFDGLSGIRFLNKLVAVTGGGDTLERHLRAAVQLPTDAGAAGEQLRSFVGVLRALALGRRLSARDLQPARAAFFVSLCWHVQRPRVWPAFHLLARRALARQGALPAPSGDPATDYLMFRESFLTRERALEAEGWELEYLCRWQHSRTPGDEDEPFLYPSALRPRRTSAMVAERAPDTSSQPGSRGLAPPPIDDEAPGHTHAQWLLATLGRGLGCRVWIAANDRTRTWNGEALGALSVRNFPALAADPPSRRVIELIDVVWLQGSHRVVAAFEVEHTTSVYSGLLRLADLAAVCPNLTFPLYIVAPDERLPKVRRELARPVFQALGLHRRCGFFSSEALSAAATSIMQWATTPSAVDRLAEYLPDVPAGDELAG